MASSTIVRLADTLSVAYRLQHGSDLVPVLGLGSERSNAEAIATWIRLQLEQPDEELCLKILNLLMDRLERVIFETSEVGC